MYPLILMIHVLGATVWTGGHLVLALSWLPRALRERSIEGIRAYEDGFERVGIPALLTQVVTGLWLADRWLGGLSRVTLLETPQARGIALKLGLLAVTVALAADARLRIIPKISPDNLRALAWHIVPVTLVSVAFALTGVWMRTGAFWIPAVH